MREREPWDDVVQALMDKTLYTADRETLDRYLLAVTDVPPSSNPDFQMQLEQAAHTIRHLITQYDNHAQFVVTLRWAKIAGFAAIICVILMLFQLFC